MRHLMIYIIKAYQWILSPWLGNNCRFTPTCSVYAIKAFENHGFFKGIVLTFGRFVRCHPWGGSGYDPVPKSKQRHD